MNSNYKTSLSRSPAGSLYENNNLNYNFNQNSNNNINVINNQ